MVPDNIYRVRVPGIALGTIALVILLIALNYGARATPITQTNNSSSETGITYTQAVPFAKESINDIIARESKKSTTVQTQRVIPFHKAPPPKKVSETAPFKPQIVVQNVLTSPLAPVLGSNFIGITQVSLIVPPDTMGAAGPSHLMEMTNDKLGFFNKSTGALISSVSLQTFWASLGTGSGQPDNFPFDPKALYDQNSNRFIAVTMGANGIPGVPGPQSSWLMIAISNTSDPTGSWTKWAIDADNNSGDWADFPGLGVDDNNVYVTANIFSFSEVYQYGKVWVIPKIQLLNGNASITWTEFSNPTGSGFTMQPAHVFGSSSTEYLINEGYNSPSNLLNINKITFPGGTPIWTNLGFIQVNSYPPPNPSTYSYPDAPQSGSGTGIATNDARLLNAVFLNGYLWTTHTVINNANTKTEVAWYQIDPANASTSPHYGTPVQQGRISDVSRWYYFPSIAVNSRNDVGIGFSGSNSTEYAGAYYTTRNASDAPGTMQSVGLLKAGLAPYVPFAIRWGDYSATVVDPADDTSFWTVQEYAGTSNLWGTWWGKFSLISIRMPSITGFAPNTPVSDFAGASRTFNITVNQTANVTWYINGSQVKTNTSVTGANYTNTSAASGFWNVTAVANNTNGTASQQWLWNVTAATVTANLTVFVRGTDNAVYTQKWNGSAWSGSWQSLGCCIVSNITAISSSSNISVFGRGTDNGIYTKNWNGTVWSGWQGLGCCAASDIGATSSGSNITIFIRGGDNGVYTKNWNGSTWSGWQSLGCCVASNIAATSSGSNISFFARAPDSSVWTRNWNGSTWSGWQSLGCCVASNIAVTSFGSNISFFARASDSSVWTRNWNGSAWSGWQGLGCCVSSDIGATSSGNNISIFARATDNAVYTKNWNDSAWSSIWQGLGCCLASDIGATSSGSNITIFARATDNAVYTKTWNGSAWSSIWQGLGGSTIGRPEVTTG
jgi:hypothetical protein